MSYQRTTVWSETRAGAWLLVALAMAACALGLRHEAFYGGFNANDINAHESLVLAILDDWRRGGWGLDVWHDQCCLGSAAFRTYQPLGHLIVAAILTVFEISRPAIVLHALMCLAICLGCAAAYAAARWIGGSRREAVAAAWLWPLVSCLIPLGHDLRSYLFVGKAGLFTQALAAPCFLLTLALTLRVSDSRLSTSWRRDSLALGLCFSLTFAFQHLYGYLACLVIFALGFAALVLRRLPLGRWLGIAGTILAVFLLLNGYQLRSLIEDAGLLRRGEFDPSIRWDGYGVQLVRDHLELGWFWDYDRLPIFSILTALGCLALLRRRTPSAQRVLPILVGAGVLLVIGRAGLGSGLDWIPGIEKFPLERSTVLIGIPSILLAGIGAGALFSARLPWRWGTVLVRFAVLASVGYLAFDRWMLMRANDRELAKQQSVDAAQFDSGLFSELRRAAGNGYVRTYVRRGDEDKLGEVSYHCVATQLDIPQLSMSFYNGTYASEAVYYFYQENPAHYRFFNITASLIPDRIAAPAFLRRVYGAAGQSVYESETEGPLGVIAIPRVARVPGATYVNDLGSRFFLKTFQADGNYDALVPDAIARRWPAAVPVATPAGEGPAGEVIHWEKRSRGDYRAVLRANRPGVYGMLRQSYHPRWRIRVNGRVVSPLWGTPGLVVFPLEAGDNQVEAVFPADPWRALLFVVSAVSGLLLLGGLAWSRVVKSHDSEYLGGDLWVPA